MAPRPGILARALAAVLPSPAARTDAVEPGSATTPAERRDGWKNALAGFGLSSHDKRRSNSFSANRLTWYECEELWRGEGMGARIVEVIPKEMTREGWEVHVPDDKDAASAINSALDDWNAVELFYDALSKQRGFGGAAILLGVNDGRQPWEPLDLENAKSLDWVNVMAAYELPVDRYYEDPAQPKYGLPRTYFVNPSFYSTSNSPITSGTRIHESRIIPFRNVPISRRQVIENRGWGDTIFMRVIEEVSDYGAAMAGAAGLMQDFAQGVLKMTGLADLLSGGEKNDTLLAERLRILDLTRSIFRTMVLDEKDDFERKQTPMSGYPETLQQFMLRLAAVTGIPVTVLMGQSPAGLNATGDADIRSFYQHVASEQNVVLRPRLNTFLRLLFKVKNGPTRGQEPKGWSLKFRSLWQLTEKEQADLRKTQSDTDKAYVDMKVVDPLEIRKSRFGGAAYSTETTLDPATKPLQLALPMPGQAALPAPATPPKPSKAPEPPGLPVPPPAPPAPPAPPPPPARMPPSAPPPAPASDAGEARPPLARSGIHLQTLVDILHAVAEKRLPRTSGVALIKTGLGISQAEAEEIMGDVGRSFVAPQPAA